MELVLFPVALLVWGAFLYLFRQVFGVGDANAHREFTDGCHLAQRYTAMAFGGSRFFGSWHRSIGSNAVFSFCKATYAIAQVVHALGCRMPS